MKEYVIHVTKTVPELNGEWGIVFTTETTHSGKEVTFCAIRNNIGNPPYSGCSVKHPKDAPDEMHGIFKSFRRAVKAMLQDGKYDIHLAHRFNGALVITMGRPGYLKATEKDPNKYPQNPLDYPQHRYMNLMGE